MTGLGYEEPDALPEEPRILRLLLVAKPPLKCLPCKSAMGRLGEFANIRYWEALN